MTAPLGGLHWCLKIAIDSFGNQSGSHKVTGRDCMLGNTASTALLTQPEATTGSTHRWQTSLASAALAWKGLDSDSFIFPPSPIQFPHRISYTVPLKLNMWVSPLGIRLHDSRNDLRAPESPPVPCQLRRMITQAHTERAAGRSATAQETCPRSMVCPSLDTTFLWFYWEWQRHIRWISERQMNVYTQKNAIRSAAFAANPAALNEAFLPSPNGSVIERS